MINQEDIKYISQIFDRFLDETKEDRTVINPTNGEKRELKAQFHHFMVWFIENYNK